METENSQNVFSVSITHNSKIRELSNGNRVIVCQTTFLLWIPPFLSYKLWKQKIKLWNLPIQTAPNVSIDNKSSVVQFSFSNARIAKLRRERFGLKR